MTRPSAMPRCDRARPRGQTQGSDPGARPWEQTLGTDPGAQRVKVTGSLLLSPPDPTALTVATNVPGARFVKNADRSTVMSPFASGAGLPRSDEAAGVSVFGSVPLANTSRR